MKMTEKREDERDRQPGDTHRAAFLAGWTEAVSGQLYETVLSMKTHRNMGNLFGWIYGDQSRNFKLAIWYHYLENSTPES
jgi:hypothetical protein